MLQNSDNFESIFWQNVAYASDPCPLISIAVVYLATSWQPVHGGNLQWQQLTQRYTYTRLVRRHQRETIDLYAGFRKVSAVNLAKVVRFNVIAWNIRGKRMSKVRVRGVSLTLIVVSEIRGAVSWTFESSHNR